MNHSARKTKIFVTAGPACLRPKMMKGVIQAGADMIRINASHTETKKLPGYAKLIRRSAKAAKRKVGILLDLQGPRLRTGRISNGGKIKLEGGSRVEVLGGAVWGGGKKIAVPFPKFALLVKKGNRIYLDNGTMELRVLSVKKNLIRCRVLKGGALGENKGINLPDTRVKLPILSAKDLNDLRKALSLKFDCIAASFVRTASDIETIRRVMKRAGHTIPIMAKIERVQALHHIQEILEVSDAVMVARGDLGIEAGVEKVPFLQKELIRQTLQHHKPVVTATQMLETMIEQPRPTRAEVSDVANAVLDGTTAVMLSGESAVGKFPLESVKMMALIISTAENYMNQNGIRYLVANP